MAPGLPYDILRTHLDPLKLWTCQIGMTLFFLALCSFILAKNLTLLGTVGNRTSFPSPCHVHTQLKWLCFSFKVWLLWSSCLGDVCSVCRETSKMMGRMWEGLSLPYGFALEKHEIHLLAWKSLAPKFQKFMSLSKEQVTTGWRYLMRILTHTSYA